MLIIAGLLFAGCLAIFRSYLFGDKLLVFTDIGSDTYDQYLMQYQTIINHLRDGDFSFWDFNNGYGINMFSLSLFDPFLILLYLFGYIVGADKIYGILVILQIVRIILAGLALYGFLSCFSLTEHGKAAACCAYGLSGYIIVWGQHYQFATVVISFPLLLMAAEKGTMAEGSSVSVSGRAVSSDAQPANSKMIKSMKYFSFIRLLSLQVKDSCLFPLLRFLR